MNGKTKASISDGCVENTGMGSDTLRDAMYQQAHEFVDAQLRSMSEKQKKLQGELLARPNRHPFLFVIGDAEGSTGKVQRICPVHGSDTSPAFNYIASKSNCGRCAGNYKTDTERSNRLNVKYGDGWTFSVHKLHKKYDKSIMQVERPDGVKVTQSYGNLLYTDKAKVRFAKDIEVKKASLVKKLKQNYGTKWSVKIEETDLRNPDNWRATVTRPDAKQIRGTFADMLVGAMDFVSKYKDEQLQKAVKEAPNPFSGSSVAKLVKKLLRDENIDFITEKTFETLRAPDTNALLRCDIALMLPPTPN